MKILTLSGWGQPHDALSNVALGATHFDYTNYKDIDESLTAIAKAASGYDAVIGWSLGGQLALRSIAAGLFIPKKLVLIGVPFQFVSSTKINVGMPPDKFKQFRDNYSKNPVRTLAKAWELVAIGDSNQASVHAQIARYSKEEMLQKDWLHWLDMLEKFSATELDFSKFPATLLLHGKKDAVVDNSHAEEFLKVLPQARYIALPESGHAPHWHDTQAIKSHIEDYLHV